MRAGHLGGRLMAVWRAGVRWARMIAAWLVVVAAVMVSGARRGRW